MQRTLRFRLTPTAEQSAVLNDTMQGYTDCFNVVASYGWLHQERNGVTLHKATYYPLRAKHPALPSQLVVSARVKATEAVRSALVRQRQGRKTGRPQATRQAVRYDARSYTVRAGCVSLATTAGRLTLALPSYPYAHTLLAQAVGLDSADVIYRRGTYYLHLVLTIPDVQVESNGVVVGVDFGITRPAVTSSNRFFGARRWKATERRYFRLKRALQSKGTPSAKRHLRRLARKVQLFRTDSDHVVSRQLVQSVDPGTTIVIENLTEIRSRTKQRGKMQRRAMHQWPFKRLRDMLTYKAEARGCQVVGIDPRHTSQRCSKCGHIYRSNRRSQSRFKCRQCGFELNADLNAGRNIAAKYRGWDGIPVSTGPLSTGLS